MIITTNLVMPPTRRTSPMSFCATSASFIAFLQGSTVRFTIDSTIADQSKPERSFKSSSKSIIQLIRAHQTCKLPRTKLLQPSKGQAFKSCALKSISDENPPVQNSHSNLDRLSFRFMCLGPVASIVKYGRLMSVCGGKRKMVSTSSLHETSQEHNGA